jgi:hypothetical protein
LVQIRQDLEAAKHFQYFFRNTLNAVWAAVFETPAAIATLFLFCLFLGSIGRNKQKNFCKLAFPSLQATHYL